MINKQNQAHFIFYYFYYISKKLFNKSRIRRNNKSMPPPSINKFYLKKDVKNEIFDNRIGVMMWKL